MPPFVFLNSLLALCLSGLRSCCGKPDKVFMPPSGTFDLQLRTGAHQRCACWGIGVFLEVLNEQFCQRGCFFLPLFW